MRTSLPIVYERQFWPSGSKVPLAAVCSFPWASNAPRWPKRVERSYTAAGSGVHEGIDAYSSGELPETVTELVERHNLPPGLARKAGKQTDRVIELLEAEAPETAARLFEIALAYHIPSDTARLLEKGDDREATYKQKRQDEIVCTLDLVDVLKDGRLRVRDWKTGFRARGRDPRSDWQLLLGALASARVFKISDVVVEFAHVDEGGVFLDTAPPLDELDLDDLAHKLRDLAARWGKPGAPNPGPHCGGMYCPIASVCPATSQALAAVDKASELKFPLQVQIISAEHAAYTRERLKVVQEAIDTIAQSLGDYARSHPVPIGGGKLWGLVERETPDIKHPRAEEVLRAELGEAADIAIEREEVVKVTATKESLKRAARTLVKKRGDLKEITERTMAALREAGATRTWTVLDEFTPAKTGEKEKEAC